MKLFVVVSFLFLTACWRTHNLGAPMAPTRVVPAVSAAGAPGPGLARVLLDVQEGPAVVEQLSGGSLSAAGGGHVFGGSLEIARRVCVTPCVLDTSPGPHELRFTLVDDDSRTSTGFINADAKVSAYRHALGRHSNSVWKGFVGWPLLITGVVLDLAMVSAAGDHEINGGFVAGGVTAVGLTALGGWLVYGSVIEDQPGSGVQWYPE